MHCCMLLCRLIDMTRDCGKWRQLTAPVALTSVCCDISNSNAWSTTPFLNCACSRICLEWPAGACWHVLRSLPADVPCKWPAPVYITHSADWCCNSYLSRHVLHFHCRTPSILQIVIICWTTLCEIGLILDVWFRMSRKLHSFMRDCDRHISPVQSARVQFAKPDPIRSVPIRSNPTGAETSGPDPWHYWSVSSQHEANCSRLHRCRRHRAGGGTCPQISDSRGTGGSTEFLVHSMAENAYTFQNC